MLNFANFDIMDFAIRIGVLTIAFTVHELCHGLMALFLGDNTAKKDGRLTLNPVRHIDPMGMIFIIFFSFGWAKPVMVDPGNFKYPKYDMALVAVAGPISNFIMASISTIIYFAVITSGLAPSPALSVFIQFMHTMIVINLVLGIFNLIPIPPLDGSKLFGVVLPDRLYFSYIGSGSRIGMLMIFILIMTNQLMPLLSMMLNFALGLLTNLGQALFM